MIVTPIKTKKIHWKTFYTVVKGSHKCKIFFFYLCKYRLKFTFKFHSHLEFAFYRYKWQRFSPSAVTSVVINTSEFVGRSPMLPVITYNYKPEGASKFTYDNSFLRRAVSLKILIQASENMTITCFTCVLTFLFVGGMKLNKICFSHKIFITISISMKWLVNHWYQSVT